MIPTYQNSSLQSPIHSEPQCFLQDFMTLDEPELLVAYLSYFTSQTAFLVFQSGPNIFPREEPFKISTANFVDEKMPCPLGFSFSNSEDSHRVMIFPFYKLLLIDPMFRGFHSINDFVRFQVIPCFQYVDVLPHPLLIGFTTRSPYDFNRPASEDNIEEDCSLYLYIIRPKYNFRESDLIICTGETPSIASSSQLNGSYYFNSADVQVKDLLGHKVTERSYASEDVEIYYNVGVDSTETLSPSFSDRMNPRIDRLVLSFSDFTENTMNDFTIAFDTTSQRRIDRSYMFDSPTMAAIKQYWMTSDDPLNPPTQCDHHHARIVIREVNASQSVFTLALGKNATSARCVIPIPIHLVHHGLMSAPYLDHGTWNDQQIAAYVQLHPNQPSPRLFRVHTTDPKAKWNFFNPHLAPYISMETNNTYDKTNYLLTLEYIFVISGPEPEIKFSGNNYFPSADFFSLLFNPIDDKESEGYLSSWFYITNPIDFRTPSKHIHVQPSEAFSSQPLFLDDYNGFLKMFISFKISLAKSKHLQPFKFELMINQQPRYISFLPDLEPTYTFDSQSDEAMIVKYSVKFIPKVIIDEGLIEFVDSHLIPLTVAIQPRFKPFDLTPLQTRRVPACFGKIVDQDDQEIVAPIAPTFSIKPNDFLTSIFSPTKSTSIQTNDILMTINQSLSFRCTFYLEPSTLKPLPFGTQKDGVPVVTIDLEAPLLFSRHHPPTPIQPYVTQVLSFPQQNYISLHDDQRHFNDITNTSTEDHNCHYDRLQILQTGSTNCTQLSPGSNNLFSFLPTQLHGWTSVRYGYLLNFLLFNPSNGITTSEMIQMSISAATSIVRNALFFENSGPYASRLASTQSRDWYYGSDQNIIDLFTPSFSNSLDDSSNAALLIGSDGHETRANVHTITGNATGATIPISLLLTFEDLSPESFDNVDTILKNHIFYSVQQPYLYYVSISSQPRPLLLPIIETTSQVLDVDPNPDPIPDPDPQSSSSPLWFHQQHKSQSQQRQYSEHRQQFQKSQQQSQQQLQQQLQQQHQQQEQQPTQTTEKLSYQSKSQQSEPDIHYVHGSLPAYSRCAVDGNCYSTLSCIKGLCAPKLGLQTLSNHEMYIVDLYQRRIETGIGLPSEFRVHFPTHDRPVRPAHVLESTLIAVIVLFSIITTGAIGYCIWVCAYQKKKKKKLREIELQTLGRSSSDEEDDDEDYEDEDDDEDYEDEDDNDDEDQDEDYEDEDYEDEDYEDEDEDEDE